MKIIQYSNYIYSRINTKMRSRNIYLLFTLLISYNSFSQLRDTSLFTVYSRPFYYNVVKNWKGEIYAGSSDGIFQFKESKPVKLNENKGYLKIDQKGNVIIDTNGIKYHQQQSMMHLLPYPTEKRDEYHAGNDNYFYITSGGRMHVYEILPYAYKLRNHSIRTISSNFIGTYSGIFYKNRLLGPPVSTFTDGYIREYNGKVFMCTNGLDVFDMDGFINGNNISSIKLPTDYNFTPARDIRYSNKFKKYVVASGNRLGILDSNLKSVIEIFKAPLQEEIVLLNETLRYNLFYFSSGNQLYMLDLSNNQIVRSNTIKETITDGNIQLQSKYLLTSNGLYQQLGEGILNKIVELRKAHTMLVVSENEFIISTDEGLYLYRQNENKLQTLIPGVEFNKRALFLERNKLYAGSINGLYILDLNQIDIIIRHSEKMLTSDELNKIPIWILLVIASLICILIIILYNYKRRLQKIQQQLKLANKGEEKVKLSRLDIINFIQNNLTTASLKSIVANFDTNNSMIYNLLSPDKPGDIIQQLRYEKVKELKIMGKSAKQIGEVTGLSDSYVRKIWNN